MGSSTVAADDATYEREKNVEKRQPGTKVTLRARKLKRNPFPCELHTAGSATLFVLLEKVPQ